MPDTKKRSIWQKIAIFFLNQMGWQIIGEFPRYSKCVIIGAHHTSNWDFAYAMLAMTAIGEKFNWIGKDSLFRWPLGRLARSLGGIPVIRSQRTNFVYQMVKTFQKRDKLVIVIAPEGTRKYTPYWKSGFYYIALGAQIPLVMGFIDYSRKQIGFGPALVPGGDIQADFAQIRAFYADKQGLYPEKEGDVALRPVETVNPI